MNPLAIRLLAGQVLLAAVAALAFWRLGFSVTWQLLSAKAILIAFVVVLWASFAACPGREREWFIPDTLFAFLLVMLLTYIAVPAQYPALGLGMPLVDEALARADSALGIHVPDLAEWTRAHPGVNRVLTWAYFTLMNQFLLIVPVLGFVVRDRAAVWEYVFHYHVCMVATLVAFALFPAESVFQYYGFESTIDQTRFLQHFQGARAGTLRALTELEGLVSMPSFHAAGGLMVTWALRRRVVAFVPVLCLNLTLVAATVATGAHYAVDVIAAAAMLGASMVVYRRWAARLVDAPLPSRVRQGALIGASPSC